jgi:hypothetical protein
MDATKLSVISDNIINYCIKPNCEAHNIDMKELLRYMFLMNTDELDRKESFETVDGLKLKKKRGRPPKNAQNNAAKIKI